MELLHPAMSHVSLESWQWIHQVAAPFNVIRGSGLTCHWIRQNVRHIRILHLVSISTTSPQSTCHFVPVSEILSKLDHPRQKKMTSCRFSTWRISAIMDFRDPIMGSLKSPITITQSTCSWGTSLVVYVSVVGSTRDLGVVIDSRLSMADHVASVCRSAVRILSSAAD